MIRIQAKTRTQSHGKHGMARKRGSIIRTTISGIEWCTQGINSGEIWFGGLKNSKPSLGGNSVVIHIYFFCIAYSLALEIK
jgi:hypothetical protein